LASASNGGALVVEQREMSCFTEGCYQKDKSVGYTLGKNTRDEGKTGDKGPEKCFI